MTVDGAARFRVVGDGRSRALPDAEEYRVVATVTPAGLVERLRANYEEDGTRVEVGFEYREVGTTIAPPPFWYSTARATARPSERESICRPDCSFPSGRAVGEERCVPPTPTPGPADGPIPALDYSSPRMPGSVIFTGASTSSASSGER
jgi:hypothetical protein